MHAQPLSNTIDESRHVKTNKMALRPAKTQISLIRVFAVRMKEAWVLSYPLSAQRRLRSDWADAQADLSLRWAHIHSVGFVVSRLRCVSLSEVVSCSQLHTYIETAHDKSQQNDPCAPSIRRVCALYG